jgi:hypothetical protein
VTNFVEKLSKQPRETDDVYLYPIGAALTLKFNWELFDTGLLTEYGWPKALLDISL